MCVYHHLTDLTEIEVEDGWRVEDRGDFVVKVKIWREEHRRVDGSKARIGTHKKTFEVVGDHRCNSYNIETVPAYRMAMQGLREGTASAIENRLNNEEQLPDQAEVKNKEMIFDAADLAGSVLAEYEMRGGNMRRSFDAEMLDGTAGLDINAKAKPADRPKSRQTRGRGGVAVANEDAKTRPGTGGKNSRPKSQNNSRGEAVGKDTKPADKNFTFDDFSQLQDQVNPEKDRENQASSLNHQHHHRRSHQNDSSSHNLSSGGETPKHSKANSSNTVHKNDSDLTSGNDHDGKESAYSKHSAHDKPVAGEDSHLTESKANKKTKKKKHKAKTEEPYENVDY